MVINVSLLVWQRINLGIIDGKMVNASSELILEKWNGIIFHSTNQSQWIMLWGNISHMQ